MFTFDELLASLGAWGQPRDGDIPFKLSCRIEAGATVEEIEGAGMGRAGAGELVALWSASREAWLFEDVEYGQWGLHLLSPSDCAARTAAERVHRPEDVRSDDVVFGELLGDAELLVYAPSEEDGRRCLIALPLDPRDDWYPAGRSAVEVLEQLLEAGGEKYWEQPST